MLTIYGSTLNNIKNTQKRPVIYIKNHWSNLEHYHLPTYNMVTTTFIFYLLTLHHRHL